MYRARRRRAQPSDGGWRPQARELLDVVHQSLERVEPDQPRRVGHEVRERVDVVEVDLAVALALQILDAADVDLRGAENREHPFDDPVRWRGGLDLKLPQGGGIDRAEVQV